MTYCKKEIIEFAKYYGLGNISNMYCIDSSHGKEDIRENWILDKKYVLRINSRAVMDESRLEDLNRLIDRYLDYGIKAPKFIKNILGKFIIDDKGNLIYCSQYLDMKLVDEDISLEEQKRLNINRLIFIAQFADKYKNVDIMGTYSMYSLIDLSPYDKAEGIDEKQQNFNKLIEVLVEIGCVDFADKLNEKYAQLRAYYESVYKTLPRCVFQGDENFTNICLDDNGNIGGIFDFNMAGTDVIANYLANIVLISDFYFTDEDFNANSSREILKKLFGSFEYNNGQIKKYYNFEEFEYKAYLVCVKIVMISGFINTSALIKHLRDNKNRDKALEIIKGMANYEFKN